MGICLGHKPVLIELADAQLRRYQEFGLRMKQDGRAPGDFSPRSQNHPPADFVARRDSFATDRERPRERTPNTPPPRAEPARGPRTPPTPVKVELVDAPPPPLVELPYNVIAGATGRAGDDFLMEEAVVPPQGARPKEPRAARKKSRSRSSSTHRTDRSHERDNNRSRKSPDRGFPSLPSASATIADFVPPIAAAKPAKAKKVSPPPVDANIAILQTMMNNMQQHMFTHFGTMLATQRLDMERAFEDRIAREGAVLLSDMDRNTPSTSSSGSVVVVTTTGAQDPVINDGEFDVDEFNLAELGDVKEAFNVSDSVLDPDPAEDQMEH